jgi:hypothetical protein
MTWKNGSESGAPFLARFLREKWEFPDPAYFRIPSLPITVL